jgi:hypothetical protein
MAFLARRGVGLFLALALSSPPALAQATEADRVLAQSLFEQGRQLMEAKSYAEACPKLAESQRLDPGGGTLLNLARCHELEGRIATAWAEYKEALGQARSDGRDDRAKIAEEHLGLLEPRLARLTIQVATRLDGLEVVRNGAPVRVAAWGVATPVDPGSHTLRATAPGHEAWQSVIEIREAEQRVVEVPALVAIVAPAPPPVTAPVTTAVPRPPAPVDDTAGDSRRTLGFVALGVGVVGLGVGAYFGVSALNKRADSDRICSASVCKPGQEEAVSLNDEAARDAWIANVGIGIGILAGGLGVYLLSTAPSASAVSLSGAPGGARVSYRAAF